jgi:hypothetical protein
VSLRSDRVLSMALWYGRHRLTVTDHDEQASSAAAFDAFAAQFDPAIRDRMTAVYLGTLAGTLVEDRRTRGRQLW